MKDKSLILIIDDQIQNIELLEAHLLPCGYEIVAAASGEEALEKLANNQIDLILLDVRMPGMDGFEVTRRIREDTAHRLLPIILVTALHEMEDRIKGIEAGCDDFLSKPFDKTELLARVQSLLKVKQYNDLLHNYQKKLEKDVIKRTEVLQSSIQGTIKILGDILSLTNPEAFNTAQQSKTLTSNLCKRLQVEDEWEFEIAAILSQIGLITLPADIVNKSNKNQHLDENEQQILKSHPATAQQLISNIPRLGKVAMAIGCQMMDFSETLKIENKRVALMARMLKLTLDFVTAERLCWYKMNILADFKKKGIYDPEMLVALEEELMSVEKDYLIREISPYALIPGMVLANDIFGENSLLIVTKGTEITEIFKAKLLTFLKFGRKISNIKILERIESKP